MGKTHANGYIPTVASRARKPTAAEKAAERHAGRQYAEPANRVESKRDFLAGVRWRRKRQPVQAIACLSRDEPNEVKRALLSLARWIESGRTDGKNWLDTEIAAEARRRAGRAK